MSDYIRKKTSVTKKALLKHTPIEKDSLNIKHSERRVKSLAIKEDVEESEETYKIGTLNR